jgi:hypothetical protein
MNPSQYLYDSDKLACVSEDIGGSMGDLFGNFKLDE